MSTTVPDTVIQEGRRNIAAFLSHSFPSLTIEHAPPETVMGVDGDTRLDPCQVYYRIVVPAETKHDILETRSEIHGFLREQLRNMEHNSPAPDTVLVSQHHPPRHIKKRLIFYVRSTL